MSKSGNSKPGCLAVLFSLLILFYVIYTPLYFIVLNDEIDSFQEVSLIDMIVEPIKVIAGNGAQEKKFISGLSDALAQSRDRLKKATGVDIGKSLESALKKNNNISDINWSRGKTRSDGRVVVTVTFTHKDHGHAAITAIVQERSFFDAKFSDFLLIDSVRLGSDRYSGESALLSIASLYGLEGAILRDFGAQLSSIGVF